MILKASDYPLGYPVYSYVTDDGENVHIDSPRLREWVLLQDIEVVLVPVEEKIAKLFVEQNAVSLPHIITLIKKRTFKEPIIFGKWEEGPVEKICSMLIDGHHRYVLHAIGKAPWIKAHILERSQWEPFQIEGFDDLTQDQLKQLPILPRGDR